MMITLHPDAFGSCGRRLSDLTENLSWKGLFFYRLLSVLLRSRRQRVGASAGRCG